MGVVLSLDLGTTTFKAALCDDSGRLLARSSLPADSGMEFDAGDACDRALRVVAALVRDGGVPPREILAVAVASQRATVVPVGADGAASAPAMSWQDARAGDAAAEPAATLGAEHYRRVTGLPPSFLWSVSKILRFRRERPEAFARTGRFVLLHDWVLHALGVEGFVTDVANASLTGLLDVARADWSDEILDAVRLTRDRLSRVVASGTRVGSLSAVAAGATGLEAGTPLVAGGGDQQCAALGLGVVDPGRAALCLGTAAVVSCPVERPPEAPRGGFFCTVHVAPGRWVLEGIHNAFGASLRWAAAALGLPGVEALEELAAAGASGGVRFVPHLAGAGSPEMDAGARAAFVGLGLEHDRRTLARAVFEGVALETRRILESLGAGVPVDRLVVSGGASRGALLIRLLADLTGRTLELCEEPDVTLVGAALLAWTGIGRFGDAREAALARAADVGAIVAPALDAGARDRLYAGYAGSVGGLRSAAAGAAGRVGSS
ncbi:MAG: hypothetical protein HY907_04705 [Deltaproteobacteria bacterium]|nr:hypothetical protein [Deltaproteobacteria bacterium]